MSWDERGSPEQSESAECAEEQQTQIESMGSTTVKGRYSIHCLTIVGQIEGHQLLPPSSKTTKYEHVLPQLAAIEEAEDIDGLIILINTVGGDIEAGLAIAELISGMKKPNVSLILGGGHSIGVPLGVAAQISFIAPSAAMTIHPVRQNGTVLGVPQAFSYMQRVQGRIVRFVARNSRAPEEEFSRLMHRTDQLAGDVGTVLGGEEAVALGLIDRVGSLSDALEALHEMIDAGKGDPQA